MKNIIKFAVGNPVTICMVVFALLLLGKVRSVECGFIARSE